MGPTWAAVAVDSQAPQRPCGVLHLLQLQSPAHRCQAEPMASPHSLNSWSNGWASGSRRANHSPALRFFSQSELEKSSPFIP